MSLETNDMWDLEVALFRQHLAMKRFQPSWSVKHEMSISARFRLTLTLFTPAVAVPPTLTIAL